MFILFSKNAHFRQESNTRHYIYLLWILLYIIARNSLKFFREPHKLLVYEIQFAEG